MRKCISISVFIIFLLMGTFAFGETDLKFTTGGITMTPDPAAVGNEITFTVHFKPVGGAVDNLKIIGGIDDTAIFERTYAHINADAQKMDFFKWTAISGSHKAWFKIDPNHNTGDTDYSNNLTEKQFTVSSSGNTNPINFSQVDISNITLGKKKGIVVISALAKPNLQIWVTYSPNNSDILVCDGRIDFTLKIKNIGDGAAASAFKYNIYYHDDLVLFGYVDPLGAGQEIIKEKNSVLIPCDSGCASSWKFVVDPDNTINESNEEDNSYNLNLNCTCAEDK